MDKDTDTNEIIPCIVDIIPTTDVNNIKYIDWKKFNCTEHYKNIVVWQLSGLETFLFFNLKLICTF